MSQKIMNTIPKPSASSPVPPPPQSPSAAAVDAAPASPSLSAEDAAQPSCTSFDDMGLPESLLRGIYSLGFEVPSPVQQHGVPAVCSGRDVLILAKSGSGKTAMFAVGGLYHVQPDERSLQVVALSPTRELALQTADITSQLAQYMGVGVHALVGGRSVRDDREVLASNSVQVVCGTPGRVLHMLREGSLRPDGLQVLILDEADVMLDRGFAQDVCDIFSFMPADVQAVLASATFPRELQYMVPKVLREPVRIELEESIVPSAIRHCFVDVGTDDVKASVLLDLYEFLSLSQTIVFCNTRQRAEHLARVLEDEDFAVAVLHSDMPQAERDATLKTFVDGFKRVLIATDIVARGIDVQQVSVVINYDLPREKENYVHRVGRAGRYGRKGLAVALATDRDAHHMYALAKACQVDITPLPQDVSQLLD